MPLDMQDDDSDDGVRPDRKRSSRGTLRFCAHRALVVARRHRRPHVSFTLGLIIVLAGVAA